MPSGHEYLRARGKQLCIFSELKGTLCTKLASFTFCTPLSGLIGSPDTIGNISRKEIAVNSVPYVVWGLFDRRRSHGSVCICILQ